MGFIFLIGYFMSQFMSFIVLASQIPFELNNLRTEKTNTSMIRLSIAKKSAMKTPR